VPLSAYTPVYQITQRSTELAEFIQHQQLLIQNPDDATLALKTAKLSMKLYSKNGNSRFIGTARSALTPWWKDTEPPLDIWLTRARLTQTEHHFEEAAQDLALLNKKHRGSPEALLLENDAWRRAGKIVPAKKACIVVAFAGRPDLAQFCTAEILLSQGNYSKAHDLMQDAIEQTSGLPAAQQTWGRSIYGDTLQANSQLYEATVVWASIIQTNTTLLTHRLAYADVLMALSRWQQLYDLLIKDVDNTAVLLRLSVATLHVNESEHTKLRDRLIERLHIATGTRQSNLYLREQALFNLWIKKDSGKALDYALLNWSNQKG
jgi:hypothetical protein